MDDYSFSLFPFFFFSNFLFLLFFIYFFVLFFCLLHFISYMLFIDREPTKILTKENWDIVSLKELPCVSLLSIIVH